MRITHESGSGNSLPLPKMPFGKHVGVPIDKVPEAYLQWVLEESTASASLKRAIARFLDIDQAEDNTEPDPTSAAVALPGIAFRWQCAMEGRYVGDAYALEIVSVGLELLKGYCSEYTNREWPVESSTVAEPIATDEPVPDPMPCPKCGQQVVPLVQWQRCSGGGEHIRASCPRCGKFLKFLAHTEQNIELADCNLGYDGGAA